jgi:chromosome segregation ATPase
MVRLEKLQSTFRAGNIPYDADMEWDKIEKILKQQKAVEIPEEVRRYHDSKIAFIQSVKNHMAKSRTDIENCNKNSQAILDNQTATQTQETEKAEALLAQMTSKKEKEIEQLQVVLEDKEQTFEDAKRQLGSVINKLRNDNDEHEETIKKLRELLRKQNETHNGAIAKLRVALEEQKKSVLATKDDIVQRFEKYLNDSHLRYPTELVKGKGERSRRANNDPDPTPDTLR